MTPGVMRDRLSAIQAELKGLELEAAGQKAANVMYVDIGHELVEAWDALQRASESLDEMAMGVT